MHTAETAGPQPFGIVAILVTFASGGKYYAATIRPYGSLSIFSCQRTPPIQTLTRLRAGPGNRGTPSLSNPFGETFIWHGAGPH